MAETLGSPRVLRVLLVVVIVLMALAVLVNTLTNNSEEPSLSYSDLLANAAAGNVEAVSQDGTRLDVSLAGDPQPRVVYVASDSINVYAEVCAATGNAPGPSCPIQYEVVATSETGQLLGYLITALLPVILIGAFFYFMLRAARQKKE
jgi:ATP-dependent Zn protease